MKKSLRQFCLASVFAFCLGLGHAVSFAADIEKFDKPGRDHIIKEILDLLEIPGGGSYVAISHQCPPCPACPACPECSKQKPCNDIKVETAINASLDHLSKYLHNDEQVKPAISVPEKAEPVMTNKIVIKQAMAQSKKTKTVIKESLVPTIENNVKPSVPVKKARKVATVEYPAKEVAAEQSAANTEVTPKAIAKEMDAVDNDKPRTLAEALAKERKMANKRNKTKFHGEIYSAVGFYPNGDVQFRRANPDLNERNWRILSSNGLNNRINTYDPALYSRLKFVVDSPIAPAVASHINLTIDPWSYTGKTKPITVEHGDNVTLQYLSVGSNNYTIGRIVRTNKTGDALVLPELKILKGNIIPEHRLNTTFNNFYDVPEMKLNYTFMPIREAWLDFKPSDRVFLRVFPLAYEDQAMTTDDPMRLSNNRAYWEESPWLRNWQPGTRNEPFFNFNYYTKGFWDRSLAFGTKDSSGQRLTGLRGTKLSFNPQPETSLDMEVASPKNLWQEYSKFDAFATSTRLKHYFDEGLYLGGLYNTHQGYIGSELDAKNYVAAVDTGIMPLDNVKLNLQVSKSTSQYDITDDRFQTKKHGNAYYASLIATSDPYMLNKKDYFGIASGSLKSNFYKTRLFVSRMDANFESTLSNYHSTRKDAFWNRHLTFYPSLYRHLPGVAQLAYTSEDDLTPSAIGDGIDYGRMSYGWRYDVGLLDGNLKGLLDVRQVNNIEGHDHNKVETVMQTHWDWKAMDQLRTKFLFIWDKLPKTKAGIDPHIYDGETGEYLQNIAVKADANPSTTTTALGARYQLTDWAALNGVWEYTNDSSLASDNFPQGNLNSAFITTYREEGRLYTKSVPFVYSQGLFDQPPYNYYDIFKVGLELIPTDKWHIYLDYTRNSNTFAGSIDDNMNHFGIETSYLITKNWGIFGRYTYTRWNDLQQLTNTPNAIIDYRGYHNVYLATHWVFMPDSWLSLEYGIGPAYNVATNTYDPRLAYYATTVLDTQHVVKLSVLRKF